MIQLDPALVATRLHTTVPAFLSVGLARELGAVQAATLRTPSAWVILLAEQADENLYASDDVIEQAVTARIGVVMAVRDIADRTGARAGADLRAIREAVLLSLGRFIPPGADQAFRFSRGSLQSGIDAQGTLFWQDDFTLRFDRRIQIS